MEASKVYFTDFHTTPEENLLQKLRRLAKAAGIDNIDFKNHFAAIKLHFGEPGNLAYLRPNYARALADLVRELGGIPFLTDCNTLYVGRRKNAVDHLEAAYENGFNPLATGCQVIIGDGLKGTDEALIPIEGDYVSEAKIGRAVADADVILSLTHFKVHECTGIGGALKNLGMGCGSRAGKREMHCAGKPVIAQDLCVGCGACKKNCAQDAITIQNRKAEIDHDKCAGCGRCIGACPMDAVQPGGDETFDILNRKITEYTMAVVKDKPHFHISFVMDVSPCCDCHGENDVPVVADIGMFASFDPVALDVACADAVNAQPPIPGSILSQVPDTGDHFTSIHPATNWRVGTDHGEKLGLGSTHYELIKI